MPIFLYEILLNYDTDHSDKKVSIIDLDILKMFNDTGYLIINLI